MVPFKSIYNFHCIIFFFFQARHKKIFITPDGISQIHVAGDNDIGGEGIDSMTEGNVLRFSQGFGSVNDVIKLKSFQIVKVS